MSVPESIAWLETSRDSQSPSAAQIYATTILGELTRLSEALHICVGEVDERERLRQEEMRLHRKAQSSFDALEETARVAREKWDADRTDLETRLAATTEKLRGAENTLRDVHYALLNQPELTREDIANVITSVVTPYPEGEKP